MAAVIELNPDHAESYYLRGNVRAHQGDLDRALADVNRALELDPRYAKAYYLRCCIHTQRKDEAKARADLERALELDPTLKPK